MSLTTRRAEIAATLSTVDDVKGYEKRPTTPVAGDAWPLLGSLERASGLVFEVTWRVMVFLPQDEEKASEWIDTHFEDLAIALCSVGFVDTIEPVALTASATDQFALQITMRGES